MKKAVGYVRVSTTEQQEEGFSLPAQRKLLEDYAKREGFTVVEWFEEAETARRAGRTQFGRMLKLLRSRKDIGHILVEKTDRLYRNIADWVKVDDLGIELFRVSLSETVSSPKLEDTPRYNQYPKGVSDEQATWTREDRSRHQASDPPQVFL